MRQLFWGEKMKYYAVKSGRKSGIFESWQECKSQVEGYSGAEYKSFSAKAEAEAYLEGKEKRISGNTAYVDGSYNIKTGEFSYGAVLLIEGEERTFCEKFTDSGLSAMRNVAGEIKGAEFVMRYCVKNGIKSVKIVYDYMGIEAWATGSWKANKEGTKAYKRYYDEVKETVRIEFEKVKGHSGDKYNEMADKLAKSVLGIR